MIKGLKNIAGFSVAIIDLAGFLFCVLFLFFVFFDYVENSEFANILVWRMWKFK